LWNASLSTGLNAQHTNRTDNALGNYPGVQPTPKVYICPSDPTIAKFPDGIGANYPGWGGMSYAANWQVFGNNKPPANRAGYEGYAIIPTSMPDGTSNTIGFAEKYAWGTNAVGSARTDYGALWANNDNPGDNWTPAFAVTYNNTGNAYRMYSAPPAMFQ